MSQRYTMKDVERVAQSVLNGAIVAGLLNEGTKFYVHKSFPSDGIPFNVSLDRSGTQPVPFIDLHGVTSAREAYERLRAQARILMAVNERSI